MRLARRHRVRLIGRVPVLHDVHLPATPFLLAVHDHPVRKDWLQAYGYAGARTPIDLAECVTLQRYVSSLLLAQLHRRLIFIWRVGQRRIHRVLEGDALFRILLLHHRQRHEPDRLADHAIAGPHHRVVQRGFEADRLAGPRRHPARQNGPDAGVSVARVPADIDEIEGDAAGRRLRFQIKRHGTITKSRHYGFNGLAQSREDHAPTLLTPTASSCS